MPQEAKAQGNTRDMLTWGRYEGRYEVMKEDKSYGIRQVHPVHTAY